MAPRSSGPSEMTRAYQREMFEASLRENIIVVVRFDLGFKKCITEPKRWTREAVRLICESSRLKMYMEC